MEKAAAQMSFWDSKTDSQAAGLCKPQQGGRIYSGKDVSRIRSATARVPWGPWGLQVSVGLLWEQEPICLLGQCISQCFVGSCYNEDCLSTKAFFTVGVIYFLSSHYQTRVHFYFIFEANTVDML